MYRGWICCPSEDNREFLESLGVVVGSWNDEMMSFDDCEVSDEALDKLDAHWGRYVWGLEPEEQLTEDELCAVDDGEAGWLKRNEGLDSPNAIHQLYPDLEPRE
jgi:hypothetical protein